MKNKKENILREKRKLYVRALVIFEMLYVLDELNRHIWTTATISFYLIATNPYPFLSNMYLLPPIKFLSQLPKLVRAIHSKFKAPYISEINNTLIQICFFPHIIFYICCLIFFSWLEMVNVIRLLPTH